MESTLVERVCAREPRAVARVLSMVEDRETGVADLLAQLYLRTGRAFLVGVTGPPGAGKSTLVSQLIGEWRARGREVGVLAVDPTSPYSGGALLGDRVRLQRHSADPGVFVRSMATRGQAGGLARATADAAAVLDAAGFDVVIIETVGVGQGEIDVVRLADTVVVTLVPGTGDEIQALKAGIMEIGDVFVVNKADLPGADQAVASLEAHLALAAQPAGTWHPPVLSTVGTSGEGIVDLVNMLERFRADAAATVEERRRAREKRHRVETTMATLDHVGIAVGDDTRSFDFFTDALALSAGPVEDVAGQRVRVRFIETAGASLELVEASDSGSPVAGFLSRRGPGLHHVALRVPDLAGLLVRLEARGVRLVDKAPRRGAHGRWVAFVHPESGPW